MNKDVGSYIASKTHNRQVLDPVLGVSSAEITEARVRIWFRPAKEPDCFPLPIPRMGAAGLSTVSDVQLWEEAAAAVAEEGGEASPDALFCDASRHLQHCAARREPHSLGADSVA
eukprot:2909063-Rhodomonas_salina.2